MVHACDDSRNPEFRLCQKRYDQIHFVITGRCNDHLTLGKPSVVQCGDFARVGQQAGRPLNNTGSCQFGVLVDQEHFVMVLNEFSGDGPPYFACSGYCNAHASITDPSRKCALLRRAAQDRTRGALSPLLG